MTAVSDLQRAAKKRGGFFAAPHNDSHGEYYGFLTNALLDLFSRIPGFHVQPEVEELLRTFRCQNRFLEVLRAFPEFWKSQV